MTLKTFIKYLWKRRKKSKQKIVEKLKLIVSLPDIQLVESMLPEDKHDTELQLGIHSHPYSTHTGYSSAQGGGVIKDIISWSEKYLDYQINNALKNGQTRS